MAAIEYVRILNVSRQMVAIQTRRPKSDFYLEEQQIRLAAGKDVMVQKDHLLMDQIDNLCQRGVLRVVSSSTT